VNKEVHTVLHKEEKNYLVVQYINLEDALQENKRRRKK